MTEPRLPHTPDPTRDTLPVTVVIPAYNRADLVARAVRSALGQRPLPPAEVLVIDDCSRDHTADVARAAGATVLELTHNLGEAGARNSGLSRARFDWVAFLDSDDEWLPHHLATLWPRREGHAVVASTALVATPELVGICGHPSSVPLTIRTPASLVFPSNPIPLSASMARRDVLLQHGGFRSRKAAADLDMWVRVGATDSILVCPEATVVYYVHPGQISQDQELMFSFHLDLVRSFSDGEWYSTSLERKVEGQIAWDLLRTAIRGRDRKQVRHCGYTLLKSVRRTWGSLLLLRWRFLLRRRAAAIDAVSGANGGGSSAFRAGGSITSA